MADEKEKNQIFKYADEYREYFKEDEDALQGVVDRLTKLQTISDTQITQIEQYTLSGSAASRGTQHYLIEHITNAIQIQSQMQSVLKDKRSIKESALTLALKKAGGEENTDDAKAILASLTTVISDMKKRNQTAVSKLEESVTAPTITPEENDQLDEEIKRKLGKN